MSESVFFTKILASGILFPTAVNAELVAKPVMLGIIFSMSVIVGFKSVFLARTFVSGFYYLHH